MSSHDGLVANGYVWTGTGRCSDCGKVVLWYRTPNQKHVPMDPETYAIHFATCGSCKSGRQQFTSEDLEFLQSIKVLEPAPPAKHKKSSKPGQCDLTFEDPAQ
jgi:hypothetical protein